MSAVKSRKTVRPQTRSKSYRPFSSGGVNYHSHPSKDSKGPDYFNHDNTNEQLTASFLILVGCTVEVQTSEGRVFEGILETISPEYELSVRSVHTKVERKNKRQDTYSLPNKENIIDTITFPFSDIVCIKCSNVDIDFAKKDGFMTDSNISGNGLIKARELKKWEGSEETAHNSVLSMSLEDTGGMVNGWDYEEMLRVNKEKYGVKTSFDSSMSAYMSEIEFKDTDEFKETELKAQRLVHEIEKDASFKERDDIDSGITEEDRYSAVVRQDASGSYARCYAPGRGKKNFPSRSHSGADNYNKQMQNSHARRADGDRLLYSQLVKKSIPQQKPQDLNLRSGSSPSPRNASPTHPVVAASHSEETKIKQPAQQAAPQTIPKRAPSTSPVPQPVQPPPSQPSAIISETTDTAARNGLDKPNETSRLKAPISSLENGKGGLPKRREIKETSKYGKVIKQETQETVDIESLKKFKAGFKLNQNVEKSREKEADAVPPLPSPAVTEEPHLPRSHEVEEPVIEVETTTQVSSEPCTPPVNESKISNNKDAQVVEVEAHEAAPPSSKESADEAKIDVTKSKLNPLAAEFDPQKLRAVPRSPQYQPSASPALQNVYSSTASAIHVSHLQSSMVPTNSGNQAMGPRPAMMATPKRAGPNRVMISAVQEQGGAVVPGNPVPTYIPNNPVLFMPQNSPYSHQGQVISLNVPQPTVRYVINNPMNQHSVVQQPMSVASAYQETSPAVFLGSQPSQVIPHTVMTATQPGYGHAPPQQQSMQQYVLPSSGHYSHITPSLPPSQQAGTPGHSQIHPHAVHPSAQQQQQRGPYLVYPFPHSIGMQPSQMVPGQPHPGGMQNFQHSN